MTHWSDVYGLKPHAPETAFLKGTKLKWRDFPNKHVLPHINIGKGVVKERSNIKVEQEEGGRVLYFANGASGAEYWFEPDV